MNAKGFAMLMGSSLQCSIDGADWHFSIRRNDDKSHGQFFEFHEKPVTPNDVEEFLPNWKKLEWNKIDDSMLGKGESYAKDMEFRINVLSLPKGEKSHEEVVNAFYEFMKA